MASDAPSCSLSLQQRENDDVSSTDLPTDVLIDSNTSGDEEEIRTGLQEPLLSASSQKDLAEDSTTTTIETYLDTASPPFRPPWRSLLFFKFLYFLNGLSASTWGRFGIIFYNTIKHLSSKEIGTIRGIMPFISFVTMPIWGWIADRIHSRKRIFILCKLMTTLSLLCMALPSANGFWALFLASGGMAIFQGSSVLDAHVLDFLGDYQNKEMYGSVRIYASISWGLGAVIMGYVTDSLGFEYNFILFVSMCLLQLFFVIFGLPARSRQEQARYDNTTEATTPSQEILLAALFRIPVAIWLVEVAIIGAGMSLVDSFLFVYLQNDLGGSTVLCGYSVGVTVLCGLPIFAYSKVFLHKVGHDILFLLAMAAYTIRVLGYAFLTPNTVHYILCLEILHGFTYASMWIASVDFSATVAPDQFKTTVQSILETVLSCVGGGIGPLVGGVIMEEAGARFMYSCGACLVGGAGLVHFFLWCRGWGHDAYLQRLLTPSSHS